MQRVIPIEDMVHPELLSETSATIEDPEQTRMWSQAALSAYTHVSSQVFLVAFQQ